MRVSICQQKAFIIRGRRTNSYIKKSLEIIDAEEPLWLDHDEVSMIREQLGDPPNLCYPLYMFTVGDGENERVAYIGKTSSSKGRFYSGHSASTKLHAPKYNGLNKRIYLGGIVLLSKDNEYQPLEWVHPLEMAMKIFSGGAGGWQRGAIGEGDRGGAQSASGERGEAEQEEGSGGDQRLHD